MNKTMEKPVQASVPRGEGFLLEKACVHPAPPKPPPSTGVCRVLLGSSRPVTADGALSFAEGEAPCCHLLLITASLWFYRPSSQRLPPSVPGFS